MSKTKYPGVTRTPSGGIKYRGTTFAGFNKPKRSNRAGKKGMVLAKEGEKIKLIHYGESSMGHNDAAAARKNFKARHGKNRAKGKMSAAYWANKELWSKGGSKKSPPKSQKHKKYGRKKT